MAFGSVDKRILKFDPTWAAGGLGLCGQVTPPIILKIWLMIEKMRDQSNSGTEHGHDVITVVHAHRHHRTFDYKTQSNLQNKNQQKRAF